MNRGDESSADIEDLAFNMIINRIENNELDFNINFSNPEYVSIGSQQDILKIEVIDPDFFASRTTGSKIEPGYTWSMNLPKMHPTTEF